MKGTRFTFRIRDADIEFIQENLPSEFNNISDFIRTTALKSLKGQVQEGGVIDTTLLDEMLDEVVDKILKELFEIKSSVTSIHSTIAAGSIIESNKMKVILVKQLVDLWVDDPNIGQLQYYDELVKYVKYDHLKKYSRDAIQELVVRKLLTVTKQEKLKWNL